MTLLLTHGADPNAQDVSGNTPLHYASAYGELMVIRTLLNHGANPVVRNAFSWTPVSYSFSVQVEVAFRGWIAEVERLGGAGAVDQPGAAGRKESLAATTPPVVGATNAGGAGAGWGSSKGGSGGGGVRLVSEGGMNTLEQGEDWGTGSSMTTRRRLAGPDLAVNTMGGTSLPTPIREQRLDGASALFGSP